MKESSTIPLPSKGRYGIAFLLSILVFSALSNISAQERGKVLLKRTGVRAESGALPRAARSFPDTVRVLAIMADFQQDTDARTSGNGKFILQPVDLRVIDPPPHDSTYFAYKLLFLENYFRKSSNGKLIVKGEVFGQRITLPKSMSAYSPPDDGTNDKLLADLIIESWRQADSLFPAINFGAYDAYVIFHAGVGRDINLVSLLGFDPTPNDIPSLYVGLPSLRAFLNNPSYAGVPVENGAVLIPHTILLPETETRVIESAGRSDTLHIGINGLLASSFGNYLGLPDLFDTKTGSSAIGQFGLMDVASIFAFNGLFPPEPSAWEKAFLGWTEPITVGAGSLTISLPAAGLTTTGNDSVYKIPISAGEYFLIENRNRDPLRNGQRLTLVQDGQIVTKHFATDTTVFSVTDIRGVWGSLIDVEDFDWSLPGFFGSNDTLEGGGLLVWHIDENIIAQKFAANEVNADPGRRGVALEEADGAEDIGQNYDIFDAGLGLEFGSPFDCWFQQNPATLYKNVFDRNSFPNSNSNSGARTGITLKDVSRRSPRMTATIQIGDSQFQRLQAFSRSLAPSGLGAAPSATHPTVTSSGIFVGYGGAVYAFQHSGASKTSDPIGLLSSRGGQKGIAAIEFSGVRQEILVGVQDSSVYIWNVEDANSDGVYDSISTTVVPLNQRITTAPTVELSGLVPSIVVGGEPGRVWELSLEGGIQQEYGTSQSPVHSLAKLAMPTRLYYTSGGQLFSGQLTFQLGDNQKPWLLVSTVSARGNVVIAGEEGGTNIAAIDENLGAAIFQTQTDEAISALAAGDVDLDGNKDVLVSAGKRLHVFNKTGAALDGYPVSLAGESFTGAPLLGDIDGDGRMDVVSLTSAGTVVAYDERGRLKEGYPLQTIAEGGSAAFFQTPGNKVGLVAISSSGEMQAWELSGTYSVATMQWPQHLHDSQHTNSDQVIPQSTGPKSTEFFPKSLVYNWPNPVYGTTTQIRYFVSEDAAVTIKIFDLVGSKITELSSRAIGGIDNELTWDVTRIQSGVYLAHVEVNSGGRTESAVIKIAVIK